MNVVAEKSGADRANARLNSDKWGLLDPFSQAPLRMDKNGYLLVYISDEQHRKVFFDNVTVEHVRGRLLEENHYYPFGLTLRTVAPGGLAAREKYQGKELQEELGLELYDFHARQYDPQIGRFWGIDPADQFPSGYTGMGNDPANMIDPTGMETKVVPGSESSWRSQARGTADGEFVMSEEEYKANASEMAAARGEDLAIMGGGMSTQGEDPDIYWVNSNYAILAITRTIGPDEIYEVHDDGSITTILGTNLSSPDITDQFGTRCNLTDLLTDGEQVYMERYYATVQGNGLNTWAAALASVNTSGIFPYPRIDARSGDPVITHLQINTAMCYPSPRNNLQLPAVAAAGLQLPPMGPSKGPDPGLHWQFSPNVTSVDPTTDPVSHLYKVGNNPPALLRRTTYKITNMTAPDGAFIRTDSPLYHTVGTPTYSTR